MEAGIYAELDRLRTTPVDAAELTKAKNQLIAQHYRSLRTIAGRAQAIGAADLYYGDWQHVNGEEALLNAVTPADIQRVVTTYFLPSNRTVATLIPDNAPTKGGQ